MHLLLAKYNFDSPTELNGIPKFQYEQLTDVEALLNDQILDLEKQFYPFLIPDDDIQRLLWIPGIGKMNAFTILLEVDDINRFPDVKNFFSYCRLTPSARNSAKKSKQRSSKDGNKYLKIAFCDAAIQAVQYYPVIRKYHNSLMKKKNKRISKTIIAKKIAAIVYHVLNNKTVFNNKFRGQELQHLKSLQWPRVVNTYA